MRDKEPRIQPHLTMNELAKRGAELYHPYNPHVSEYSRKLGSLSLTDGLPVITEAPKEL